MLSPKNKNDIQQLKNSLRIDHDEDDYLIGLALGSAIAYLENSIGNTKVGFYDKESSLIDLAILMLADHFYKNRSATFDSKFDGTSIETDRGITSIILQLKADYATYKEVEDDAD